MNREPPESKLSAKKMLKIILVVSFFLFLFLLLPLQIPWNSSIDRFIADKFGIKESDAPRTPSGLIDITSLTNDKLADGVTAENNIVVDYVQVFDGENVSVEFKNKFLRRLQLDSADGPNQWVTWKQESDQDIQDFEMAMSRPWLASENQAAHDWITANNGSLDQFVMASKKTHYYHPLIAAEDGNTLSCLLPYAQSAREAARGLTARALNHVAKGDLDAALADTAATRRLGFLMQQGGTLVENLVGMAMIGIASGAEAQILASGKLTDQQCSDYRQLIAQTNGWSSLGSTLKNGHQAFQLDAIQRLGNQGGYFDSVGLEPSGNIAVLNSLRSVTDWEQAAQVSDEFMTKLIEIFDTPDDATRIQMLSDLENEFKELQVHADSVSGQASILLGAGARGQLAGESVLLLLAPAVTQIDRAAVRTRQLSDFVDLGFALEQHRIANGSFPADSSVLDRKYIAKLPIDRFTGNPIRYELMTTRTGYRLTSTYNDKVFDPNITPLDQAETGSDTMDDTTFTIVIE